MFRMYENEFCKRKWKEESVEYLRELQRFFDVVENVKDEKLKMRIIYQMLKCDEVLTKLAEKY